MVCAGRGQSKTEGKDAPLPEVSWDDFFCTFDDRHLACLYHEQSAQGKESRFFKFMNRENEGK